MNLTQFLSNLAILIPAIVFGAMIGSIGAVAPLWKLSVLIFLYAFKEMLIQRLRNLLPKKES